MARLLCHPSHAEMGWPHSLAHTWCVRGDAMHGNVFMNILVILWGPAISARIFPRLTPRGPGSPIRPWSQVLGLATSLPFIAAVCPELLHSLAWGVDCYACHVSVSSDYRLLTGFLVGFPMSMQNLNSTLVHVPNEWLTSTDCDCNSRASAQHSNWHLNQSRFYATSIAFHNQALVANVTRLVLSPHLVSATSHVYNCRSGGVEEGHGS